MVSDIEPAAFLIEHKQFNPELELNRPGSRPITPADAAAGYTAKPLYTADAIAELERSLAAVERERDDAIANAEPWQKAYETARTELDAIEGARIMAGTFVRGDRVEKKSGSSWHGVVVGEYSTSLTPEGYCVESEREPGSVQLYPAAALKMSTRST